ncbi:MAG: hypothetical protein NC453_16675 [Muribaculum sp.]|nr:hypothetical protein [Muribaculum sp.]
MNQEQIAEKISIANTGLEYAGGLTPYAIQSIKEGRSNYPVSNLLAYCGGLGLRLVMFDMATEDCFYPTSVLEVHQVLNLLMTRYKVDYKLVYRKTAVHYTAPKSLDEKELEKMKSAPNAKRFVTPLSIKTLLAVCDVIHCDLRFEPYLMKAASEE